jgi:DNA-binding protein
MPRRYVKIALFAAGILLAWLSYRLVESPFRHLKLERKREKLRVALVGIVCLTLIVVPSRLVEVRAIDLTENVVERALERAADPGDIYFGARATQHTAAGSSPYGKIDPEWAQFGSSFFGGRPFGINPYTNDISDDQPVSKAGELGAITSDKTILFIGDSYSEQWYSAIHIAACNLGFKVIAAASTTCGSGVFELDYDFGETWVFSDGSEKSVAKANERFNYIRNELWPKADIVIVAVSPAYYTGTNTNPENSPLAGTKLAQTLTALNETIGKKPILIQAIPIIAGFNEQTDQIYIDARDKRFADVTEYMDRVYTLLQKEGVADVVEYLRVDSLFLDDEGYAHTQIGGLPVYYNNGHINALYSASAGEYFTEELRRIIDDME